MTDVSTQHSIYINTLAFQPVVQKEEYFDLDLPFKSYNLQH